ncbi:hypothetical protein [Puia dinghuensis]|uniref:Uncharacterized protein n=1 Tax=Puia dinghuensis TaxID=1792502 RepID=A0A8J2XTR3_9BACT|nr:hypothetical protein [Puia dinghuensis]GGB19715.1 hypothetical protein GCM10011511_49310 [Puia dinghuensis]
MKKTTKKKRGLFDHKVIFIVDKRLNNLNVEAMAPEKLAEANRKLSKMKLPK